MLRLPCACLIGLVLLAPMSVAAGSSVLPIPLAAYPAAANASLPEVLGGRIASAPFNLVASVIFLLAIGHTFFTARFRHWAHSAEEAHARKLQNMAMNRVDTDDDGIPDEVSFKGQILHFFGEVEAVFGLWVVVLAGAIAYFRYLKVGLALVLAFVGVKMLIDPHDAPRWRWQTEIPPGLSLAIVGAILLLAMACSLVGAWRQGRPKPSP